MTRGQSGRWAIAAAIAAIVAWSCVQRALPTAPRPESDFVVCPRALLQGVLEGDSADPSVAWLRASTGVREEITWPYGYTARFSPELEVVAPDGSTVAREGERLDLTGGFHGGSFFVCRLNGERMPRVQ